MQMMQSFLSVVSMDLFIYLDLNDYLKSGELLSAVPYCSSTMFFSFCSRIEPCVLLFHSISIFCDTDPVLLSSSSLSAVLLYYTFGHYVHIYRALSCVAVTIFPLRSPL